MGSSKNSELPIFKRPDQTSEEPSRTRDFEETQPGIPPEEIPLDESAPRSTRLAYVKAGLLGQVPCWGFHCKIQSL